MADSFTPSLNLRKPEVGAAYDTWGGVAGLNADLDLIDAIFLATGLGTSVGIHVGTGKVLNVEGSMQLADSTDTTKRAVFTAGQIPAATVVELKVPAVGGTIATVEVVTQSHPVGTVLSGYYGTAPAGFVMVDGRTIGDATSAATNRANDDCQRLFLALWGLGFVVVGGRGATAAADWAAHRQLTLPNHSGRTMVGRDNLSGTAANVLPGYNAIGVVGGQSTEAAGVSVSVSGGISGSASGSMSGAASANGTAGAGSGAGAMCADGAPVSVSGTLGVGGSFSGSGSGATASVTNVQPSIAVDVIMAL
jgi:hypothetical protein